jgi:hypothetical protein
VAMAPEDQNPRAHCSVLLDLSNMGALSMDIQVCGVWCVCLSECVCVHAHCSVLLDLSNMGALSMDIQVCGV